LHRPIGDPIDKPRYLGNLPPGPHTVEAMAMNYAGVEGWSMPLVIEVVK
jgi:hypothetical protein